MGGKYRSKKIDVLVTSSAWLSHPLKVEADWSITAFYIVSHRFGKKSAGSRYCSFSANGANAPGVSGSHRWCKEWKSNKRKCSVSRNGTYPPKEPLIVMGTCTSVASKHFHCLIGCKVIGTTTFTRCSELFRCVWPSMCGRWNGLVTKGCISARLSATDNKVRTPTQQTQLLWVKCVVSCKPLQDNNQST